MQRSDAVYSWPGMNRPCPLGKTARLLISSELKLAGELSTGEPSRGGEKDQDSATPSCESAANCLQDPSRMSLLFTLSLRGPATLSAVGDQTETSGTTSALRVTGILAVAATRAGLDTETVKR